MKFKSSVVGASVYTEENPTRPVGQMYYAAKGSIKNESN